MIIGIAGSIASGKTLISETLVEKGFIEFDLSDGVIEEAMKQGIPIERKALQNFGNAMREKYGNGYWAYNVIKKLERDKNYAIRGFKNPGEVDAFKQLGNFILIGIDAPLEKRIAWILARNKSMDPKTAEEIKAIDLRDKGSAEESSGQQSRRCYDMADVFILNDGTFDDLSKKILELLEIIKC